MSGGIQRNREEQTRPSKQPPIKYPSISPWTYRTHIDLSKYGVHQPAAFPKEALRPPHMSSPLRPVPELELKLPPEYPQPLPEIESSQKQIEGDQENSETPANYGQWLSNELKQRGWSMRQFAAMLAVPVALIWRWEKNRSYPGFSLRQQISDLLTNKSAEALQEGINQASQTNKQVGHDEGKLQIQINTPS